jgi:5-oxoprolinase (ATP-hydrolysing) subunit A
MRIDLNADVGEGNDDLAIFPLVTSVSVACGAHAGDEVTMDRSVREAARLGVVVGAHPGYPDREGKGRRGLSVSPAELHDSLLEQIHTLARICVEHGVPLAHVKPHGALYNRAVDDRALAEVVATAVKAADPALRLVGLAGSALLAAAFDVGLSVAAEAFADRRYLASGRLASRDRPDSLIVDPAEAARQAVALATGEEIGTLDGDLLKVRAETICIHADTPGAVDIARAVRRSLKEAGVQVSALHAG